MTAALRQAINGRREHLVLATGGYNWILWQSNLRRTIERRLRQMRTDYIDVFHFLGALNPGHWTPRVAEELQAIRESGLVRAIGISTHDLQLAAHLADSNAIDAIMIRYNASHRHAERDLFPRLAASNPAVTGFTATRWSMLTRRPKGYPSSGPVPTAGMCYRFVLSNPHVHVCLTAPSNRRQLEENLAEVRRGPLDQDEAVFMRGFGDVVQSQHRFFL
jgi:aryl-alcohol dehydrogenase-like predicted oxidoreductase